MPRKNKKQTEKQMERARIKQILANYPVVINPPERIELVKNAPKMNSFDKRTTKDMSFSDSYKEILSPGISKLVEEIAFKVVYDILDGGPLYEVTDLEKKQIAQQKYIAFNFISLSAMASLLAARVLSDKNFAKKANSSLVLQRAINLVLTDPGIVQKLRYNINNPRVFEAYEFTENYADTALEKLSKSSGVPINILNKAHKEFQNQAYKTGAAKDPNDINKFVSGDRKNNKKLNDLWNSFQNYKKREKFFNDITVKKEIQQEEHGAGEEGTDKLVHKYEKDTPYAVNTKGKNKCKIKKC